KPSTIKSGTSNVVLIGEKYVPIGNYDRGEAGYDDVSGYYGYLTSNARAGDNGPYQDAGPTSSFAPLVRFGSAHPISMNAVFADGSVRPISYSTTIFALVCDRTTAVPV